jgi:ParB-like chromosome segregation protein Spo0J
VSAIRTDAGTQSRARIDEATAADYAEAMVAGDKFPPVVVFQNNGEFILADGFHRVRAAKMAKLEKIAAEVYKGGVTDALKYSLASNHAHGLRRTNEDKRHAISVALKEFTGWSDGAIAELCGVSQSTVSSLRRQLKHSLSCEVRLGRDGKKRRMPTKTGADAAPKALEVVSPNGNDREAHRAMTKVAERLSEVEDLIAQAARRYPDQKGVLRGFVAKMRSDLAFLEKELGGSQAK